MRAAVLVSGFPAAGKSTLASRLGSDLGFVVVCRDRLVASSGLRDMQQLLPHGARSMVPATTDRLVDLVVESVFAAGHGVVIDNNFNWPEQRDHVTRLLKRHLVPCAEICLWGDPPALKERFAARADPRLDDQLSAVFDLAVQRPREPVLPQPTAVFEFDTTDLGELNAGYDSLLTAIRARFESATAAAH